MAATSSAVFVSYSHRDKTWVREVLVPRLRGSGVTVKIDHEAFIPGESIVTAIQAGIHSAKHVLFVCSKSFVESEWTRRELQESLALDPSLVRRKCIPVVLDRKWVPQELRAAVWCDFSDDVDSKDEWRKLLRAVSPPKAEDVPWYRSMPLKQLKQSLADGESLLHAAARAHSDAAEAAEFFLSNAVPMNKRDRNGQTALHAAAAYNNSPVANALLDAGCKHHLKDKEGKTPLDIAVANAAEGVVEALVAHNVTLEPKHMDGPIRHLRGLALRLLRDGAPPPLNDDFGWDVELAQILLERGASPNNQTSPFGYTRLHDSIGAGDADMVEVLLKAGANTELYDYDFSRTSLQYALREGQCEIAKLLIDYDACVYKLDFDNNTSLHLAASRGCTDLIDELLRRDVDTEALNIDGMTALHLAAMYNHAGIVCRLISHSARIDAQLPTTSDYASEWPGDTPLHLAVRANAAESLRALLEGGASTEVVNATGDSAIHVAAYAGAIEAAKILVSYGASTKHVNAEGKTPIRLARSRRTKGHIAVVQLLKST